MNTQDREHLHIELRENKGRKNKKKYLEQMVTGYFGVNYHEFTCQLNSGKCTHQVGTRFPQH